jgi:hypothetical protein
MALRMLAARMTRDDLQAYLARQTAIEQRNLVHWRSERDAFFRAR